MIEVQGQTALVDPAVARNGEVPRGSRADGEAVEARQLPVTGFEVLEIDARKQVAVEAGGGLCIEAEAAIEDQPVPRRVRVAQLGCVGADTPGVRKIAVLTGYRGAIPQVVLGFDGSGVARA